MFKTPDIIFSKGTMPVRLVRRVSASAWGSLSEPEKLIPKATIVIDVSPMNGDDAAILLLSPDRIGDLMERQVVQAYFVIGHSATDGRPECLRIGDHTDPLIPSDLPLVPLKP